MEFDLSLKNLSTAAMVGTGQDKDGRILEGWSGLHPSGQRLEVKSLYSRALWVLQKVPDPLPSLWPCLRGTDGLTQEFDSSDPQ